MTAEPGARRAHLYAVAGLVVLNLALYGSLLHGFFMGEDRIWLDMARHRWPTLWDCVTHSGYNWFTVGPNLLFAINYRLFGLDPTGYYAAQIALHLLTVLLLYRLTWRWTGSVAAACWSAVLFSVASSHNQAVVWIAGNGHLVVAPLILLTLLAGTAHAENGRRWAALTCALAAFAAFISKEVCVSLLLILPLVAWQRGWPRRRALLLMTGVAVAFGLYLVAKFTWSPSLIFVQEGQVHFAPLPMLYYACFHVWATISPAVTWGTNAIVYAFGGARWALVLVPVLSVSLFVAGAWCGAERRVLALSLLWAYAACVPYTVFGGPPNISRAAYLPSLAWCLGLGTAVAAIFQAARARGGGRGLLPAALVGLLLLAQVQLVSANVLSWVAVSAVRRSVYQAFRRDVSPPPRYGHIVVYDLANHLFDPLALAPVVLDYPFEFCDPHEPLPDAVRTDPATVYLRWDKAQRRFERTTAR